MSGLGQGSFSGPGNPRAWACSSCLLTKLSLSLDRSLGVHISFVRSVAMDSWTPQQLEIMKRGGNSACNAYLASKAGLAKSTPIKPKYESDAAQLYKEVLKARAEGRPEPTELPRRTAPASGGGTGAARMASVSSAGAGGQDPNGMERLAGESDAQYVARQTRLRDEARARMAAKFGGGGMGGVGPGGGGGMGGAGGPSRMGGIGSDPNYVPGGGAGVGGIDTAAVAGSVMAGLSMGLGALSTAASTVTAAVQDEGTRQAAVATASSFWGGLSATAGSIVSSVTAPDEAGSDGLADLQRQFHSQAKPNSKYAGFGSDSVMAGAAGGGGSGSGSSAMGNNGGTADLLGFGPAPSAAAPAAASRPAAPPASGGALGEARAGPGEDPNGIERLTGESDDQYVMRQTRLRDEAKARMAAKFGGGGMGGVGSGGGGGMGGVGPSGMAVRSQAPSSGNYSTTPSRPARPPSSGNSVASASKMKVASGSDFFANFGA